MLLTPEQIEQFYEVGFVLVPDVFSAAEVEEMRAAFDRLQQTAVALGETRLHNGSQFVVETVEEGENAGRVTIRRITWCGAAEPVLSEYGKDPRLVGMAAQLLGCGGTNQLINQAHFKLPGDGVTFAWHQDSQHRFACPGANSRPYPGEGAGRLVRTAALPG
jgi:hypothetical protein